MADFDTVKKSQQTIVVPEYIEYPVTRINVVAGDIAKKNYKVRVEVKVVDDAGNDVKTEVMRTVFKEIPKDKDIVGIIKATFSEQPKTQKD